MRATESHHAESLAWAAGQRPARPSPGGRGLRGRGPTRIMESVSANDSIPPPGPVDAPPGQPPAHILVVDDDLGVAKVIARMAESLGHATTVAGSVDEALGRLAQAPFDVVLTDLSMPGRSGLDLLKHVQAVSPEIPVVLITGKGAIDTAMEAIKGGAYDYLAKPPQLEMLGALLRRAIEKKRMAEEVKHLQREVSKRAPAGEIIGASPQMLEVYKTLQRVAPSRTSVLILGESGTGKELVARKLHERSPRRAERFVAVNGSAIPEGLLESELFGHVRGAFTGAVTARRGLFDEAHRRHAVPRRDRRPLAAAAGQAAARDPGAPPQARGRQRGARGGRAGRRRHAPGPRCHGAAGAFREDLYYRLNVVSISLPPLRERGAQDIELLVEHFLHEYEQETGKTPPGVSPEAFGLLEGLRLAGQRARAGERGGAGGAHVHAWVHHAGCPATPAARRLIGACDPGGRTRLPAAERHDRALRRAGSRSREGQPDPRRSDPRDLAPDPPPDGRAPTTIRGPLR